MIGLSANGLNYEQIGITSWGYGCADPRYPGKELVSHSSAMATQTPTIQVYNWYHILGIWLCQPQLSS